MQPLNLVESYSAVEIVSWIMQKQGGKEETTYKDRHFCATTESHRLVRFCSMYQMMDGQSSSSTVEWVLYATAPLFCCHHPSSSSVNLTDCLGRPLPALQQDIATIHHKLLRRRMHSFIPSMRRKQSTCHTRSLRVFLHPLQRYWTYALLGLIRLAPKRSL
jgi:hypothetical protein